MSDIILTGESTVLRLSDDWTGERKEGQLWVNGLLLSDVEGTIITLADGVAHVSFSLPLRLAKKHEGQPE